MRKKLGYLHDRRVSRSLAGTGCTNHSSLSFAACENIFFVNGAFLSIRQGPSPFTANPPCSDLRLELTNFAGCKREDSIQAYPVVD